MSAKLCPVREARRESAKLADGYLGDKEEADMYFKSLIRVATFFAISSFVLSGCRSGRKRRELTAEELAPYARSAQAETDASSEYSPSLSYPRQNWSRGGSAGTCTSGCCNH